jgi:hypothetical protein
MLPQLAVRSTPLLEYQPHAARPVKSDNQIVKYDDRTVPRANALNLRDNRLRLRFQSPSREAGSLTSKRYDAL